MSQHYEEVELLGQGGFGVVFRGVQTNTKQNVAIKRLKTNAPANISERFRREMEILAQLPNHPHLVNLIDSGQADGELFIVLEFIEGVDLKVLLRRQGILTPALARRIIVQTLDALQVVHNAGIVHRDLKPANIMLTGSIDRPFVKLLDFGIATLVNLRDADDHTPLTQTGYLVGTPGFIAPELLNFEATPLSDLFAMGIILRECLTGQRDASGLVFDPTLAPYLDVANRACAADPAHRFQSASAMIEALEAIEFEGEPEYPTVGVLPLEQSALESSDHIAQDTSSFRGGVGFGELQGVHMSAESDHQRKLGGGLNVSASSGAVPKNPFLWLAIFGVLVFIGVAAIITGSIKDEYLWSATGGVEGQDVIEPMVTMPPVEHEQTTTDVSAPGTAELVEEEPTAHMSVFHISSTPPGADVLVDGQRLGVTPFDLERGSDELPIDLELSLTGYATEQIRLDAKTLANVEVVLESKTIRARTSDVKPSPARRVVDKEDVELPPSSKGGVETPTPLKKDKDKHEIDIESFIPE